MRISNVNTIASLIDRLVSERIKYNVLEMSNDTEKMSHQRNIIKEINREIKEFFENIFCNGNKYEYLEEFRTTKVELLESLEQIIRGDLEIVNAETCRKQYIRDNRLDLMTTLKNDLWLRTACEYRVVGKNRFDRLMKKLIGYFSHEK